MQCKMWLHLVVVVDIVVCPTNIANLRNLLRQTGRAETRSRLLLLLGSSIRNSTGADRWYARWCDGGKLSVSLPSPTAIFLSLALRQLRWSVNQCVGAGWTQITREESRLSNPRWFSSPLISCCEIHRS